MAAHFIHRDMHFAGLIFHRANARKHGFRQTGAHAAELFRRVARPEEPKRDQGHSAHRNAERDVELRRDAEDGRAAAATGPRAVCSTPRADRPGTPPGATLRSDLRVRRAHRRKERWRVSSPVHAAAGHMRFDALFHVRRKLPRNSKAEFAGLLHRSSYECFQTCPHFLRGAKQAIFRGFFGGSDHLADGPQPQPS